MNRADTIVVALAVLAATLYLLRRFWPKKGKSPGCGCGSADCKVPKPKIK